MALLHFWKLNDNAADTEVVATNGVSGELLGGDDTEDKTTNGPGGQITAAFDLNGTDDAIDISASSISFASGAAFTVSIWGRGSITAGHPLIGDSGGQNNRIQHQGGAALTVRGASAVSFNVPVALSPLITTKWYHFVATRDGSNNLSFYVNGVVSPSGALAFAQTFAPNKIGQSDTAYYPDKLAWFKVFDNHSDAAAVAALYAEGVASGTSFVPQYGRRNPRSQTLLRM